MKTLDYRCPFCERSVEVSAERAGQVMECPRSDCGRPFRLEIPTAQLVVDAAGNGAHGKHPETTLLRVHPAMFRKHPFRFFLYCTLVIAGAAIALWWWSTTGDALGTALAAGVAGVPFVFFALWWLRVLCATLTVTTKRTVHRTGLVSRRTSEVRHDDVRNLQLEQSAVERLFGVGDIAISSAGQSGLEIVADAIPHPGDVIQTIRERQH